MFRIGSDLANIGTGLLLITALASQAPAQTSGTDFGPRTLTPFEMEKAERLLYEKLPCLGCHELGGQGGRIGPSLSNLKATREPDYVFAMIIDPQGTVPGTVMPKVPMTRQYLWETGRFDFQLGRDAESRMMREEGSVTERTLGLVASYLLQREPSRGTPPERIPLPTPDAQTDSLDAEALYGRYCAPCHGAEGAGDGPNAQFLPVEPVSHADAEYMSGRPDDSLFDAIYVGGYIMNRSQTMPPYGETLTREQIRSLVRFLRTLCDCQGPEWSRDNR